MLMGLPRSQEALAEEEREERVESGRFVLDR
jgi:hypothetical protein